MLKCSTLKWVEHTQHQLVIPLSSVQTSTMTEATTTNLFCLFT